VALPPGLGGIRTAITAFNPDGQNSMFLAGGVPTTYTYDTGDPGVAVLVPNAVQAGTVSMVEIDGSNGNFVDGLTMAGFGSSDVQVQQAWVVAPNKIWANVSVAPNAAITASTASVITGFQVISQQSGFQIQSNNGRTPVLSAQLVNANPGQTGIFSGATVILSGSNFANPVITVGGAAATLVNSNPNQIAFMVPFGLPAGPAILKYSDGVNSASIVVPIDVGPPGVVSVSAPDSTISANRPARAGDLLNVLVTSLVETGVTPDPRRVRVNVAGVDHSPLAIIPQGNTHQVQIVLSPAVGAGQVPLTVAVDSRTSLPYYLPVSK
jgi:hypothetical protein